LTEPGAETDGHDEMLMGVHHHGALDAHRIAARCRTAPASPVGPDLPRGRLPV